MASEGIKNLNSTIKAPCLICNMDENDPINYGDLKQTVVKSKNSRGEVVERAVAAHNFCLLFSCNLDQSADDDDQDALHGFRIKDIEAEKRRGGKLTCHFCHKKGATSACCNASCKTSYHYTCAVNSGAAERPTFIFCDQFTSFCRKHEPVVKIRIGRQNTSCVVCTRTIGRDCYTNNSLIQCDCCDQLFHVSCMKQYARSAGKVHFKCVNCNCSDLGDSATTKSKKCKEAFVRKCNLQGVFVPEKDADWEYGDTFADHYKDYDQCDAEVCQCPEGRKHDIWQKCEMWYIVLCSTCASSGIHRKCGNIRGEDVDKWHCSTCSTVFERSSKNCDKPQPSPATATNGQVLSTTSQGPNRSNGSHRVGPLSRVSSSSSAGGDAIKPIKRPRAGSASTNHKHHRKEES